MGKITESQNYICIRPCQFRGRLWGLGERLSLAAGQEEPPKHFEMETPQLAESLKDNYLQPEELQRLRKQEIILYAQRRFKVPIDEQWPKKKMLEHIARLEKARRKNDTLYAPKDS